MKTQLKILKHCFHTIAWSKGTNFDNKMFFYKKMLTSAK